MAIQEISGQGTDFHLVKVKKNRDFPKKVLDMRSQNWKIRALRDWIDQNPLRLALVRVCRVC